MTDSTLSVGVDSRGVRSATDDLQKFVTRGNEAAKTTKEIEKATRDANSAAEKLGQKIGASILATGAAIGAALLGIDKLIKSLGDYQDLADKTGGSAVGFASLQTAADVASVSISSIADATVRLTTALSKTDDESKTVGKALSAIGLSVKEFKQLDPAQQYRAVAVALAGFSDEAGGAAKKTAVVTALYGKAGAEQLKVLREVGQETKKYNLLTADQLALADEYSDASARVSSQIKQLAQAAAIDAAPSIIELKKAIAGAVAEVLGLNTETGKLDSKAIKDFAEGGIDAFATLYDQIAATIKLFDISGRFIGATAAATRAFLSGNKAELDSIRADFDADLKRIAGAKTLTQRIQEQRGTSSLAAAAGLNDIQGPKKKEIDDRGLLNNGRSSANSIAKAQLASDLADIKAGLQAQNDAYKNAQSILDALRQADLVDERSYYDAKRQFIDLSSKAQVQALEEENARIAAQKASGKDLIDNKKSIAQNEAEIARILADAGAKVIVLNTQQEASQTSLQKAYIESEAAAAAYIRTLQLQASRNVAGLGQGEQERQRLAGLNAIEDKFSEKRDKLESDKRLGAFNNDADGYRKQLDLLERTKAEEVALYDDTNRKLLKKQGDFQVGISEGLQNYLNEAANVYKQTEQLTNDFLRGTEDALVTFVTTGKLSFKSLADSILADFARIAIKQAALDLFKAAAGGTFGETIAGIAGGLASSRATGGPVAPNSIYRVNENGPELLNVAGKQYLMTGAQAGSVTPNGGGDGGREKVINFTNIQNFAPGTDRTTTAQAAAQAQRALLAGSRNL